MPCSGELYEKVGKPAEMTKVATSGNSEIRYIANAFAVVVAVAVDDVM